VLPGGVDAHVHLSSPPREGSGPAWVDDFTSVPHGDLHAVWSDELGEFWAVGGDFIAKATPGAARNGTIAHFGKSTISSTLK